MEVNCIIKEDRLLIEHTEPQWEQKLAVSFANICMAEVETDIINQKSLQTIHLEKIH